jgi:glycerol-3-phosphate dehydrogenase
MNRDFSKLEQQQFDVLVCGGGIYGAWIAYDAALRGLKVAIVEQSDWASATSSASSKLIHGGLRYLETLDFKLVKKALRERQMLMQSAPHRVWPLRFGIPVFAGSRLDRFRLGAGLTLYDWLADDLSDSDRYRWLKRSQFAELFPYLDSSGLRAGFTYLDAQTDDARFVLELIDGAITAGAVAVNYCQATDSIDYQSQVNAVQVMDMVSGKICCIKARQIVNASGQWLSASPQSKAWCRLTKGVHLLMPKLLGNEALLLTAKQDGRVFYMIPWYGLTLLGTTDTDYHGDVQQVQAEIEDIRYLLTEANQVLKSVKWTEADIIGRYAGLRVLKNQAESAPSAVSRDWELKIADNGVLFSIGGKFTSAREDASHIVDRLCQGLRINRSCLTFGRSFPWLPAGDFSLWSDSMAKQALELGVDEVCAKWLIRRHGKRITSIFELIEQDRKLAQRIKPSLPFIYADFVFCAREEMVVKLDDLLRRRMPLLITAKLNQANIQRLAELAALG